MSHAGLHFEDLCRLVVVAHSAAEVLVQCPDDVHNLRWDYIVAEDFPQRLSVHAVKSLLEVYKDQVIWAIPLLALLEDLANNEDVLRI